MSHSFSSFIILFLILLLFPPSESIHVSPQLDDGLYVLNSHALRAPTKKAAKLLGVTER